MAKIKLTKTAVEAAQPQATAIELRDTVVPGFLGKITPAGRRVFMLQYRTNAGEPHSSTKPKHTARTFIDPPSQKFALQNSNYRWKTNAQQNQMLCSL
jgi:hypothetical protein